MSILDKLDINMPFNGSEGCYLYAEKGTDKIVVNLDTNKVLWSAPEMLEALIADMGLIEAVIENMPVGNEKLIMLKLHREGLLEKATGKTWEEIKELIK